MSSPYNWTDSGLNAADLRAWRYFLVDLVKRTLPCRDVVMLPAFEPGGKADELPAEWQDGLKLVRKKGKPVVDDLEHRLYLPLHGDDLFAIAVLEGGKPELYEKYTVKSLLESSGKITAGLKNFKEIGLDSLTGLFNDVLFRRTVETLLAAGTSFFLVMLEIYPRIRDAGHAQAYLKRAAGALDSISGRSVPVFHLGAGTFAMLWEEIQPEEARNMGDVILYRLQRDGMTRAHMGMAMAGGECDLTMQDLVDRAWGAVVMARQRGPFARAAHVSREEKERHPFKPMSSRTANWSRNLWRNSIGFSVALLKTDRPDGDAGFAGKIRRAVGPDIPLLDIAKGELYLFFDGLGGKQAEGQLQAVLKQVEESGGLTFSAGVAEFPSGDFKKTSIPLNARKALQHTFFYGPATTTVFSGVSLNISGDIYYNDGDLNGAVREYLLGLELDNGNVNLLNSLGVAYVRLNRLKTALGCFAKVLEVEADNFMALFNSGSAWLALGRDDLAVGFLERGLAVNDRIYDLVLQLAGLYCRTGKYARAVELLAVEEDGVEPERTGWERGEALRFLGEAWHYLGENSKAIDCLQQACRQNPQDSKVLSLLGRVYDFEGQGDDIALTLCRQAVELDDSGWDNWFRLGEVEWRQGLKQEAIFSLQKSMRLNRRNVEAARLLGHIYQKSGKKRLAERQAEKIRKLETSSQ